MINIKHMQVISIIDLKQMKEGIKIIKIILHQKHFMEGLINYILNCVMIIVKLAIYSECLIIIKNVLLAYQNILMII